MGVSSPGVGGKGYPSAGEFDLEPEHSPAKGSGDAVRDSSGVCVLTEDISDDGEASYTGLHEPDDSALPMLAVSETESSSAAPSWFFVLSLFIGGDDLALPNCANY